MQHVAPRGSFQLLMFGFFVAGHTTVRAQDCAQEHNDSGHGQGDGSSMLQTILSQSGLEEEHVARHFIQLVNITLGWPLTAMFAVVIGILISILLCQIFQNQSAVPAEISFETASTNRSMTFWDQRIMQMTYLTYASLSMATFSSAIPEAYNLMADLDFGATVSGALIGGAWLLSLPSMLVAKYLHRTCTNRQKKAAMICSSLIQSSAVCILAFSANPPTHMQLTNAQRFFGLCIGRLSFGIGLFGGVLVVLRALDVTPPKEQVPFAISRMCAITIGLGLGPLLCPFASFILGANDVKTRAAAVELFLSAFWVAFAVFLWLIYPADICEVTCPDDIDAVGMEQDSCSVEKLPLNERRTVCFSALMYGFERSLIVSALEATTVLILQVEFGWPTGLTGIAVGLTFVTALPIALLGEMSAKRFDNLRLLTMYAFVGLVASVFIFPQISNAAVLGKTGAVAMVLIADAMIFSTGYLSNGIMNGLAARAAEADSVYSKENFYIISEVLQNIGGRALGPCLARFLFDSQGRSVYAGMQLAISAVGFWTCFRASNRLSS